MASVKGLSLGKNEDPKKKGAGVAKQISVDGITVPPSVGSTKIEQPKVVNARWFGETAVQPAALTQIPQLELPSVKGIIENATPEDAGRYAEAFSDFAQQVDSFGSSWIKKEKKVKEDLDAQALKVFYQYGDPTTAVKELDSYITKIDKRITTLKELEKQTDDSKQEILDLEKLKTQIANSRPFRESLLSVNNSQVVLNRAYGWTFAKEDILVPNTTTDGSVVDKDGELSEIRVSELDPTDSRYVEAFHNYVYGDTDLSAFDLKNIEGTIANILYQDRLRQETNYKELTKDQIVTSSNNQLTTNLRNLVNSEDFSVASFIQNTQTNLEFIKNTHLFDADEKTAIVKNMIQTIVYELRNQSGIDAEQILRTIFLGDKLGTEDQVQPLMIGPIDDRILSNGTLNKKLRLIESIGGEAQLNLIIGDVLKQNKDNNDKINTVNKDLFNRTFEDEVLFSEYEDGKTFQQLILGADVDDIRGNEYVPLYLAKLQEKRQELLKKHANNPRIIQAINQSYTAQVENIRKNLLVSDYNEELMDLTQLSFEIQRGDDSKVGDFNSLLQIFEESYTFPKALEDLQTIKERVNNAGNVDIRNMQQVGLDLVRELHKNYATSLNDPNYNYKEVFKENEIKIMQEIEEITNLARQKFPDDIDAQSDFVTKRINARWNNNGFITRSGIDVSTPLSGNRGEKRALKYIVSDLKKGGFYDGLFQGSAQRNFLAYVESSKPFFKKNVFINKDGSEGLVVRWMAGEEMPENWNIIEANLIELGIDPAQFFIDQAQKLGIENFPYDILKDYEGLNTIEERRKQWEIITKVEETDVEEGDK
tara:strand:- start:6121 stop:8580 length:2460 start_codon:yes stop_codon:yes gene_type:complete